MTSNQNKEEFVIAQLIQTLQETYNSIEILQKKDYLRSQLCLAFITADSFSRFYYLQLEEKTEWTKKELNNRERFKNWLNKFVLNENNESYVKGKKELNCDAQILWELRNSLIHFYNLPQRREIVLGSNKFTDKKGKERKFDQFYKEKTKTSILCLNPHMLSGAIIEGALAQITSLINKKHFNRKKYNTEINKLHKILKKEGFVTIEF